jgi:hypothetical protein
MIGVLWKASTEVNIRASNTGAMTACTLAHCIALHGFPPRLQAGTIDSHIICRVSLSAAKAANYNVGSRMLATRFRFWTRGNAVSNPEAEKCCRSAAKSHHLDLSSHA